MVVSSVIKVRSVLIISLMASVGFTVLDVLYVLKATRYGVMLFLQILLWIVSRLSGLQTHARSQPLLGDGRT